MAAATGFCSTAEDLTAWFSAHRPGRTDLLDDHAKRLAQRAEWRRRAATAATGWGSPARRSASAGWWGTPGGSPATSPRASWTRRRARGQRADELRRRAASELAVGAVKLVDLFATEWGNAEPTVDLDAFCGRWATLWGVVDVVRAGSALIALDPDATDPAANPVMFEVVDEHTLRVVRDSGFGSSGRTGVGATTAPPRCAAAQWCRWPLPAWRADAPEAQASSDASRVISTPVSALETGQVSLAAWAVRAKVVGVDPAGLAGDGELDAGEPEAAGRVRAEGDVGGHLEALRGAAGLGEQGRELHGVAGGVRGGDELLGARGAPGVVRGPLGEGDVVGADLGAGQLDLAGAPPRGCRSRRCVRCGWAWCPPRSSGRRAAPILTTPGGAPPPGPGTPKARGGSPRAFGVETGRSVVRCGQSRGAL